MPFKPGQSGNPRGRPKTTAAAGRAAMRDKIFKDIPAVIAKLQKQALDGDVQAARTLLERVLPAIKPETLPVHLPDVLAAANVTDQARLVVNAVASGELAPDAGAALLAGMGQAARIAEVDELERRIRELEGGMTK